MNETKSNKTKLHTATLALATVCSLATTLFSAVPASAVSLAQPQQSCPAAVQLNEAAQSQLYAEAQKMSSDKLADKLLCASTAGSNLKPGGEVKLSLKPVYKGLTVSKPTVRWIDSSGKRLAEVAAVSDRQGGWTSSFKLSTAQSGKKVRAELSNIEAQMTVTEKVQHPELWDEYCLSDEEVTDKQDCFIEEGYTESLSQTLQLQDGRLASAAHTVAFLPVVGYKPTITGKAAVGSTLQAKTSKKWQAQRVSYQWYRSGKAIKGATKTSYKLVNADRGKQLTVRMTGTTPTQRTVVQSSKATGKVIGTMKKPNPKVSLTKKKISCPMHNCKATMQVKSSVEKGAKVKYQWYRNGKAIKGATKSTHTVKYKYKKNAKYNVRYTATVTVSKPGYQTQKQSSHTTVAAWVKLPK